MKERIFIVKEAPQLDGAGMARPESFIMPIVSVETDFTEGAWNDYRVTLAQQIVEKAEYKLLFETIYPLKKYVALFAKRFFNGSSDSVKMAFASTKEKLASLFNLMEKSSDYTGKDGQMTDAMKAMGGQRGVETLLRTPISDLPAKDVKDLLAMPGFNYWQVIKFLIDTPIQIFKGLTEFADPAIAIASKVSMLSKIAGVDLPIIAPTLAIQPMTLAPGSFMGPPLTPLGFVYLALSMGFSLPNAPIPEDGEDNTSDNPSENQTAPTNYDDGQPRFVDPAKCSKEE